MKKTAAVVFLITSSAIGAEYSIAPDASSYVRLEVDKTGLLKGKTHVFTFSRFAGRASYVENPVASAQVNFTIEAASIHSNDTWVSAKDLVKVQQYAERDMLAVDRFANISFHSTSITAQEPNVLKVMGPLTIRDVTKPVQVIVKLNPNQDRSLSAEGTSSIKLRDFNLKPSTAALGLIGTKDEMRFVFRLKLVGAGP